MSEEIWGDIYEAMVKGAEEKRLRLTPTEMEKKKMKKIQDLLEDTGQYTFKLLKKPEKIFVYLKISEEEFISGGPKRFIDIVVGSSCVNKKQVVDDIIKLLSGEFDIDRYIDGDTWEDDNIAVWI